MLHAVSFNVTIPGFKLPVRWTRRACYGHSTRRTKQPSGKSRRQERASEILIAEAVYNGIQYSIHDDQVVRDEPQSAVDGLNLQAEVQKSISLQCIHRWFFTFSCMKTAHIYFYCYPALSHIVPVANETSVTPWDEISLPFLWKFIPVSSVIVAQRLQVAIICGSQDKIYDIFNCNWVDAQWP